ncbi:MAG TPA: hypothetical protein PLN53_05175 [Terricaulis sp.]|nr:hypothetical protein [Terricaulis sp.]
MSFRTLIFVCIVSLAACEAPETAAPPEPVSAPAAETAPRYVGLWAVSEAMCENPAWRFQAQEVGTLGEVHCEFIEVSPAGGSFEISAMCAAEGPPAPYNITLNVTDEPREMLVSGGPWAAPTRLLYCGPHPTE